VSASQLFAFFCALPDVVELLNLSNLFQMVVARDVLKLSSDMAILMKQSQKSVN